eukprot:7815159-Pyramimonas_sp.AAC.1
MAHALLEITHGLLTGVNRAGTSKIGGGGRGWKKHILSNKDDANKLIRLIVFTRLEFQDGTRKEGTFRYQGSGRPHAH